MNELHSRAAAVGTGTLCWKLLPGVTNLRCLCPCERGLLCLMNSSEPFPAWLAQEMLLSSDVASSQVMLHITWWKAQETS